MITTGIRARTGNERPKSIRIDVDRSTTGRDPTSNPNTLPSTTAISQPLTAAVMVWARADQNSGDVSALMMAVPIWGTPGVMDGREPLQITTCHATSRMITASRRWPASIRSRGFVSVFIATSFIATSVRDGNYGRISPCW